MGPNRECLEEDDDKEWFQSSVRINVGPNDLYGVPPSFESQFQSSVRINVGPNLQMVPQCIDPDNVSILRED